MAKNQGRSRPSKTVLDVDDPSGIGKRTLGNDLAVRSIQSGKMVDAVMHAAASEGLTVAKDGRIAGRVSSELIAKAKARTGLASDTELIEFALATIAIEDDFAEAFHAVRGTIDPDMDLGF
ncbi:hypothetical protein [Aureimonas sp. Leaf460]|uniref:hypothetical protein n=2 Tax=unclassified Aureimonas TaxID=2615206 RepID=UPI000B10E9AA|nr:hypothetical protein [Aureimonas sp. Leaf460]